jgi:superoxide reductase
MCDTKFYRCKHCGNLIGMIHASGVPIICCGEPMELLEANSVDASQEKHVPAVEVEGDKVTVRIGSVPHPMLPEHHIEWVYLQTEKGGQRKCLEVGAAPETCFALSCGDKPVRVFEYCNLHGLWVKDI